MNNDPLLAVDALLRFATIGELVLAIAIIAVTPGRAVAHWLAMAFLSTVAAHLLVSSTIVAVHAKVFLSPLVGLATVATGMLWLLARALLQDDFKLRPLHWLPVALLAVSGLLGYYGAPAAPRLANAAGFLHYAIVVSLYVDAIVLSWRGYDVDLVESRRRFRLLFIVGASLTGLAIAGVEILLRGQQVPAGLDLAKVAAIFALTTLLLFWSLELRAGWFTPVQHVPSQPADPSELTAGDRQLLAALKESMEVGRGYRQEGLTIAVLARQLKVPEHLLRRTINQRLGYRNFNAFLNTHRIAEARAALADPARARIPVLTIALESGFGSIGPFNRAFRDALGMTPMDYRRQKLGPPPGPSEQDSRPKLK